MKRLLLVGCLIGSVSMNLTGQSPSADQAKIQGVWRLVEERRSGANIPTNQVSTGLWIFTGKHHSIIGEYFGQKPRPDIPDSTKATADDLRAAWDPFYARGGTYELGPGNLLTERNFVNKAPQSNKPGTFRVWSYKLDGD